MDSTGISKKWYKKWWGITLLIVGGIWLVGLISEQGSTDSASTPTATTYERQLPEVTTPEITSPPTTAPRPTTTTSNSASQSVILAALYDAVPSMDIGRDDLVLKVLDAACGLITSTRGQDFKTVGDVVVNSGSAFNLDYGDAGTIIGAAVVLRCPEWTDLATEFANSGN